MRPDEYPPEVLEAQSFPCPAEPDPIDHLRRVMRVIASGHLSASGARDLAVMVLSLYGEKGHLGSSCNGAESRAEAIRANTRILALRQPF